MRAPIVIGAVTIVLAWGVGAPAAAQDVRARGGLEIEWRGFPFDPTSPGQTHQDGSAGLTGTFSLESDQRDHLFTFEPFLRLDAVDASRTHFDVRTLSYERVWRDWELRAGVRRVFWGVTESRHLVDVINQTDLVENLDGEDKLGQPMVNLAWISRGGTVDLFLLTGFRQRTFAGADGRLRPPILVDSDITVFEEDGVGRHLGWAVRWSRPIGGWDLGMSHFNGTARDPRLVPQFSISGAPRLVPHYDRIHQTGLDAQWTAGSWLWKIEAMTRTGGPTGRESGLVAGLEYTLYQLFGTNADLGLLGEVLLDTRDTEPFQDDIFVGGRVALNDTAATAVLAGTIVDRQTGATLLNIEASRRIGSAFTLDVEIRGFLDVPTSDPLFAFQQDDHVLVRLTRWF